MHIVFILQCQQTQNNVKLFKMKRTSLVLIVFYCVLFEVRTCILFSVLTVDLHLSSTRKTVYWSVTCLFIHAMQFDCSDKSRTR